MKFCLELQPNVAALLWNDRAPVLSVVQLNSHTLVIL